MATRLIIFKKGGEHYCRITSEEVLDFIPEEDIVYQDKEEEETLAEKRAAIQRMTNKAKEWIRKEKIPFVHNLDFGPYD